MSLTELRESLSAVSDAVPVPPPDVAGLHREVRRARARGTATWAASLGAAAAVALGGSALVASLGGSGNPAAPADSHVARDQDAVPVVVDGHLRIVDGDALGPVGPAVATVVGSTPHGVVVLTDDGTLGRVAEPSGALEPIVSDRVRTAYLDGDAVVYENERGLIRWRGIEPSVQPTDSAQTEQGRLMASASGIAVIAEAKGLMLHDSAGVHELYLDPDEVNVIRGVDAGAGPVVAVRTDAGVEVFWDHGASGAGLPGDRIGALAPDGHTYARPTEDGRAVELLDPRTMNATPVAGPSGQVSGLGWSPDGDLLVVVVHEGTATLWRCGPNGAGCAGEVDDPTGTLRLR
ncbi:MAG TPA: hypothetical protein VFV89_00310 [Nocardioides sp.]|uniref:hypothetical protein n=1 Tax=Nocardioides sp. TaxID=35761 RepID=UPI002E3044AF|nr:hypothetical protein [Nocardioides sp.]HEX5086219.1 hypothetical protein [Nocardioides sp.]